MPAPVCAPAGSIDIARIRRRPALVSQWGVSLHDAHLNSTDIDSSCDNCHGGTDTFQRMVNLHSSAAAKDGVNAIACMGCHGRLEDANALGPGPGWGAGLRQHHTEAGAPADGDGLFCVDCHDDADPANFTVAGEDIMPAWYTSTTNDIVSLTLDTCNVNLEEDFSGDAANQGLDNDGDLLYDVADTIDCPEPGQLAMLLPGIGMLLMFERRRRR